MNKYLSFLELANAKKISFLVDDINSSKNLGLATDIDKIEYNLNLLKEHFLIDIKVFNVFAESEGTTHVFSEGQFIIVLVIKKDLKKGEMHFFDFRVNASDKELKEILKDKFSENIIREWFNIYNELKYSFTNKTETYELVFPSF